MHRIAEYGIAGAVLSLSITQTSIRSPHLSCPALLLLWVFQAFNPLFWFSRAFCPSRPWHSRLLDLFNIRFASALVVHSSLTVHSQSPFASSSKQAACNQSKGTPVEKVPHWPENSMPVLLHNFLHCRLTLASGLCHQQCSPVKSPVWGIESSKDPAIALASLQNFFHEQRMQ